ncbi:MAG TPA: translesion error-prone DNA polymerase V autoproteolytic subunit [Pseudomonas sp.]|nr:translesion error-prone DNA polymerase V autoproteolytic subunit [Pseudomonas sp.]
MGSATILGPVDSSDIELPFYSARVPAGFPSPAQDHLEKKLSLDELLEIDAPHTFLVRADGESMIGAGIFDGDVLVVSRALREKSGDIVIAAINGDVFVKRLSMDGKLIVLRSENPAFAPRFIMEGDELLIWGVVTASIRRHRCHA